MKRTSDPMPLPFAIFVLIAGLLMGTVFTFGMQYWNAEVRREDCIRVDTTILDYEKIRHPKHPTRLKEVAVDCENGERYFVDGVSLSDRFLETLDSIRSGTEATLLIHPNHNTIVEWVMEDSELLEFDDTIEKLQGEANGFLILGIIMYLFALVGVYYCIYHYKYR